MKSGSSPLQPVNHVFVDFENVKTIDHSRLGDRNLTFHLFFGQQNKRLDIDLVARMLENAQTVNLIRSPKMGKNALDFVLAYHLGQAVLSEPTAHFHIISKDAGFDSLVALLESKRVVVKRHSDWSTLPVTSLPVPSTRISAPPAKTPSGAAKKVLDTLKKAPEKGLPKRKKSLLSLAKSALGKETTDDASEKVVEELRMSNHLSIDEKGAVIYTL